MGLLLLRQLTYCFFAWGSPVQKYNYMSFEQYVYLQNLCVKDPIIKELKVQIVHGRVPKSCLSPCNFKQLLSLLCAFSPASMPIVSFIFTHKYLIQLSEEEIKCSNAYRKLQKQFSDNINVGILFCIFIKKFIEFRQKYNIQFESFCTTHYKRIKWERYGIMSGNVVSRYILLSAAHQLGKFLLKDYQDDSIYNVNIF